MTITSNAAHLRSAQKTAKEAGADIGAIMPMVSKHIEDYESTAHSLAQANFKITRLIGNYKTHSTNADVAATSDVTCSHPTIVESNIYPRSDAAHSVCVDHSRDYFVLRAGAVNDQFGFSSASGDIDNNGVDDIAIGVPLDGSGKVKVFLGSSSAGGLGDIDLSDAGVSDITFTGITSGDEFGSYVLMDDINGDNIKDILVGAPGVSSYGGALYAFLGSTSLTGTISASNAYLTITSISPGDSFSNSFATGDMDGDGNVDILVGANGVNSHTGTAYGFFFSSGLSGTISASNADVTFSGTGTLGEFASFVELGDINNDTIDDAIIGYPGNNNGAGTVNIILGKTSLTGAIIGSNADFIFTGETSGDSFGMKVLACDVNSDGILDLLGSATASGAGIVYSFLGPITSGASVTTAHATYAGEVSADAFGSTLKCGDFNKDGRSDIAMHSSSASSIGKVYIFLDSTSLSGAVSAANADIILIGHSDNDLFGRSIAIGDADDDSIDDIIICGSWSDVVQSSCFVMFGGDTLESVTVAY